MTIAIKDGAGASKNLKSSGTGTALDPFIPEHVLGAGTNLVGKVSIDQVTANANEVVVKSGVVSPYASPENFISGTTAAIIDTTRTEVIAAQSAGIRSYITNIAVTNSHATVGTFVKIEDGTTTIYQAYAAPVGGGFTITLPVPLRGSTATALNVSCVTTGANVIANASGYKGA